MSGNLVEKERNKCFNCLACCCCRYLYLSSGSSPRSIDTRIFYSRLCRTEKPSELDVQNVKAKAQNMLGQMDLGQWQVDNSRGETTYYGDVPEYVIHVSAVPVFHKTPAIRRPQLGNLKSDTSYASNYYLTDANFKFSANIFISGRLDAYSDEVEYFANTLLSNLSVTLLSNDLNICTGMGRKIGYLLQSLR